MKLFEILQPTGNQLTQEQILWLKSMNITDYEYDSVRGLVNVDGSVDISYKNLTSIPVQFGYVGGKFDCSSNKLTTLQGSPREVGEDFSCWDNRVITLHGGPREIGGDFCGTYNQLISFEGAPREVGGDFWCRNNNFKTEPDHSLIDIGGDFRWR